MGSAVVNKVIIAIGGATHPAGYRGLKQGQLTKTHEGRCYGLGRSK